MTGFELRTSGVGSDRWATTTAPDGFFNFANGKLMAYIR